MNERVGLDPDLLGTWRLVEWTASADGAVSYPFTPEASGRLIYGADGMMAAFLLSPQWQSSAPDFAPQRSRFVSYSGHYRIVGNTVTHAVDAASDPRWIGIDLVRSFTLKNGWLDIETAPTSTFGIGRFRHCLKWTREELPVFDQGR